MAKNGWNGRKLLETAGHCQKQLESLDKAGYTQKQLEMAGNCQQFLEMAGITGYGWKWLEIAVYGLN